MLPWRKRDKAASNTGTAQGGSQVKRKLLSALQESVSELQYEQKSDRSTPVTSGDISTRLVAVLEAIFVHGLKETFLGRLTSRLQDTASPRMPEPSFWTFCLVFSHRAVIGQVEGLGQVTTEVGRSRAWLRMALNDGLLGSYLAAMGKDQVSLSVHYEKFAFLRDQEMRDLLLTYLTGVEVYSFALSTNVSLLNRWQAGPLVLAGIWATSVSAIVEGAEDVVAALQEDITSAPAFTRTLAEPIRVDDANSLIRRGLLNEDEALRLILASTPVAFSPDQGSLSAQAARDQSSFEASQMVTRSPIPKQAPTETLSPKSLSPRLSPLPASPSPEPVRSCTVSPTLHWDDTNSCLLAASNSLSPNSLARELDNVAELEKTGGSFETMKPSDIIEDVVEEQDLADCGETVEDMIYSNDPLFEEVRADGSQDMAHWKFMAQHERGVASREDGTCKEKETLEQKIAAKKENYENEDSEADAEVEKANMRGSPALSVSSVASCQCSSEGPDPSCPHCRLSPLRPLLLASPPPGGDLIALQHRRERRLGELSLGFEQPPSVRVPRLSLTQNISLAAALDVVTQEAGLEAQDWRCHDCGAAIGAIFGPWHVCGLTSRYYCSECHTGQLAVIPARLLYNWDITPRPVAASSATFLSCVATKPIIDISTFNPSLSKVAPVLEEASRLRKQLIYLVAYLTACSRAQAEGVKVALAEVVWPREYLYTSTDTYSIQDMEQLHRGELVTTLQAGLRLCTQHVMSCLVCSGRGFICEVCQDKRPVYPFNLQSTSQCQECQTVFHSNCAASLTSCPKCERLAARSLNMHVINSKLAREVREAVS